MKGILTLLREAISILFLNSKIPTVTCLWVSWEELELPLHVCSPLDWSSVFPIHHCHHTVEFWGISSVETGLSRSLFFLFMCHQEVGFHFIFSWLTFLSAKTQMMNAVLRTSLYSFLSFILSVAELRNVKYPWPSPFILLSAFSSLPFQKQSHTVNTEYLIS